MSNKNEIHCIYQDIKDDNEKYNFLLKIEQGVYSVNEKLFKLLITDLTNHKNLDEFLVIQIVKTIVRQSKQYFTKQILDKIFVVFLENEDNLVKENILLELEFKKFSDEQYIILEDVLKKTSNINLKSIIEDILIRN